MPPPTSVIDWPPVCSDLLASALPSEILSGLVIVAVGTNRLKIDLLFATPDTALTL